MVPDMVPDIKNCHRLYLIEMILDMTEKMKLGAGYRVKNTNLRVKDFLFFLYSQVYAKKGISGTRRGFFRFKLLKELYILTVPDIIKTGTKVLWKQKAFKTRQLSEQKQDFTNL